MKGGVVRALWGSCLEKDGIKSSVLKDIEIIKNNEFNEPFVTYIYGSDNCDKLRQMGFECKLVDEKPVKYDMKKQLWRHKLEIFREVMKDFDEIVFMDWDCRPTAPLPYDFWESLGKKASFQANLLLYRTKRCLWRKEDTRKVCNGGFVYLRDKSIPDIFIKNYDELHKWVQKRKEERNKRGLDLRLREKGLIFDDEPSMSKYIDECCGKWPGLEGYWELFEPEFCNIKKSAFPRELLDTKRECFLHWV